MLVTAAVVTGAAATAGGPRFLGPFFDEMTVNEGSSAASAGTGMQVQASAAGAGA